MTFQKGNTFGVKFKKGQVSWNKGKKGCYKQTEEFKAKMRKRMSGSKNPMWEMKKDKCPAWKGKKVYCIDCKKEITSQATRCNSCAQKINVRMERNPNWRGGISFELYPSTFNQQLKDKIRVRDNFICQHCGVPELECKRRLVVHHIDYNKKNINEINLISLCNKCHIRTNYKRRYWKKYFLKKMENENVTNIRTTVQRNLRTRTGLR